MVFSSSTFLFAFLPITLAVYFAVPVRAFRNTWLLAASLFFYAWGEPVYVFLMAASILANWAFGLGVRRRGADGAGGGRKAVLVAAVLFNIAVIGFFKYEGFLARTVNGIAGAEVVPDLELPLPIGISFYTLQALSYVIDAYRGDVEPQRNVLYLGMYIACFPQLIAGPIVRYSTIQSQVVGRRETLADFSAGMRLFIVGLAKKALLANTVAILAARMLEAGGAQIGAVGAWAGIVAYTFQIYFDFGGYSDMAIGLGRMMGFRYVRNFDYPYVSRSVTEFWRRWHISLSSFFRDYVYIPLGGSRCSAARNTLNIAVVWAVTGLWHGAAWNFVLWGVYYGALLICEKRIWGRALARAPRAVGHLYTAAVFVFGWTFFWIGDMGALAQWWAAMGGAYGATGACTFWELTAWEYWPVLLACAAASGPVMPFLKERLCAWAEGRPAESVFAEGGAAHPTTSSAEGRCAIEADPATPARARALEAVRIAVDVALLALLALSMFSIVSGSFNPFIYFQF